MIELNKKGYEPDAIISGTMFDIVANAIEGLSSAANIAFGLEGISNMAIKNAIS